MKEDLIIFPLFELLFPVCVMILCVLIAILVIDTSHDQDEIMKDLVMRSREIMA